MTRILVPTDFSGPSLVTVRNSLELATRVGSVVLLLHVVEGRDVRSYVVGGVPLFFKDTIDLGGDFFRFPVDPKRIRRDLCEEARWKLDALVPPGCRDRVRTMVTVGNPTDEIVKVAREQHTDLILLGPHRRGGWRQVFRRTLADRIRRKVPIPVITLDAGDVGVGHDLSRDVPARRLGSGPTRRRSAEEPAVVSDLEAAGPDARGGHPVGRRSKIPAPAGTESSWAGAGQSRGGR